MRKMNLWICINKDCRVAFRLVFQFTANLLGSRKSTRINFHHKAPGFCADSIFILVMYFGADNIHLTDKISLHRYIGLSLLVSDIDNFLLSKVSVSKYTAKIKIPSTQKPEACWNESLCFFCCPSCPSCLQETAEPDKMRQLLQQFH